MIVKYNNKVVSNNGKWICYISSPGPGPEPGTLPLYTIRLKFNTGVTPTFTKGTGTLVDSTNNIWDLTYENTDWCALLQNQTNLLEVIDVNAPDVVRMQSMFSNCTSLTTVSLFDTSNVTDMLQMFSNCSSLTTIPLFDTSKVTSMVEMFEYCENVETGALALYNQASTQTNPPSYYYNAFLNCGVNTQTGYAELAQIPRSDWGGAMEE